MHFLHPFFLLGLGAVSVPVVIHLVFKMKARVVPFPSVRFLQQVDRKVARRQKIRELLILLLRCLALAFLALGLAGPVIKPSGGSLGSSGTAAVVVLDDSYSMGMLDAEGPIFARAKGLTRSILGTLQAGDAAGLITSRRAPAMSRDPAGLAALLDKMEPSPGAATLGPAVKAAVKLLRQTPAAQRELYVVSDFQQRAADFQDADLQGPDFAAVLVPVASARRDNLSIAALDPLSPFATTDAPFRIRVVLANRGPESVGRNLKVRVDDLVVAEQMIFTPARGTAAVAANLRFDRAGWKTVAAELENDSVPADNRRLLPVQVRSQLGALLAREGVEGALPRSFYVEKALNPGGPANTGVRVATCGPAALGEIDLADFAVVFLVECVPPAEASGAALRAYVAAGGSLVIAAGPNMDPKAFNDALGADDELGPLSPAAFAGALGSEHDPASYQSIKEVDPRHPVFARLGALLPDREDGARRARGRPGPGALRERRRGRGGAPVRAGARGPHRLGPAHGLHDPPAQGRLRAVPAQPRGLPRPAGRDVRGAGGRAAPAPDPQGARPEGRAGLPLRLGRPGGPRGGLGEHGALQLRPGGGARHGRLRVVVGRAAGVARGGGERGPRGGDAGARGPGQARLGGPRGAGRAGAGGAPGEDPARQEPLGVADGAGAPGGAGGVGPGEPVRLRPRGPAGRAGVMTLLLALLLAQDGYVASPEPGWPQWRGPRRDAVSAEKGLLQAWPEGGPRLLWKAEALGRGWSSPIVVGDRVFITGDAGGECVLYAFDLEGKPVWKAPNGRSWKDPWPGARACPAWSEGRLYHMNAHGRTACFDAATGKELWAVEALQRFEGRNITWATSECLLVDGSRVIVTPGGRKALMAGLDKKTGETVWSSEPLEGDTASYSSPILVRRGGRRLFLSCSSKHGFAVDADTGKLLWTVPMKTPYEVNVSAPAYFEGQAHFATPHTAVGTFRLSEDGAKAEPAWTTPLDTCTGGFLLVDGVLYAGGYKKFRHWIGVDWKTGETRSTLKELTTGSAVWADGRLHCLGEDGRAALVTPASDGFKIVGEFRLTPRRVNDAWAHPVVLDGRLYLRYHDALSCYDVRAR